MSNGILAFIEHKTGTINKSSIEAIAAAQALGGQVGQPVTIVVLGSEAAAQEIAAYDVAKVIQATNEKLAEYTPDAYADALEQMVQLEDDAHARAQLAQSLSLRQRPGTEHHAADVDRAGVERLQRGHAAQHRGLAAAGESHQRHQLALLHAEVHAAQHFALAAAEAEVVDGEDAHSVDILHRISSHCANRDRGSDMARYSAAHSAPGMTQLPMFAAKICVCLVSSITVITETSEESLSSETKSLVIGGSARRNACGPRTSQSTCASVNPRVRAASSCPRGTASSAPR